MSANINTQQYWEHRFATGDWEAKSGCDQTRDFAASQIRHFTIASDFSGTILDFGCGLGDAMPVYRATYPNASLVGMDISASAVENCRARYGNIADFIQGTHEQVPAVDVIIASNVFEHLSNDIEVARSLLAKCRELFIITPFREEIVAGTEHINSYDVDHFESVGPYDYHVFYSRGWGPHGWINLYVKNVLRPFFGKRIVLRKRQIMYHLVNTDHVSE